MKHVIVGHWGVIMYELLCGIGYPIFRFEKVWEHLTRYERQVFLEIHKEFNVSENKYENKYGTFLPFGLGLAIFEGQSIKRTSDGIYSQLLNNKLTDDAWDLIKKLIDIDSSKRISPS